MVDEKFDCDVCGGSASAQIKLTFQNVAITSHVHNKKFIAYLPMKIVTCTECGTEYSNSTTSRDNRDMITNERALRDQQLSWPPHAARVGYLAREYGGERLELRVLKSAAGFYLGTFNDDGPFSRESVEYWPTIEQATQALNTDQWTQRSHP